MTTPWMTVLPRSFLALCCVAGCAAPAGKPDAPTIAPGDGPLRVGAHEVVYYKQGQTNAPSIVTTAMATQSGSTVLVSVGRGIKELFALPTDNKGNAYRLVDGVHPYAGTYPNSGTALYAVSGANGGAGFQVSNTNGQSDEITVAMVEIVNGAQIIDHSWTLASRAPTVTSDSVTTAAPATLVAFWWGTGDQYDENIGEPLDGFERIDYVGEMASLVQCSVAVKNVTAPGTYRASWRASREQGAQLYLVAVQ